MGAHKTNPTAIAAKNGEFSSPRKSQNISKAELNRLIWQAMMEKAPATAAIIADLTTNTRY